MLFITEVMADDDALGELGGLVLSFFSGGCVVLGTLALSQGKNRFQTCRKNRGEETTITININSLMQKYNMPICMLVVKILTVQHVKNL